MACADELAVDGHDIGFYHPSNMLGRLISEIKGRVKPSTKRRIKFSLWGRRTKNPLSKLVLSTFDYAGIDQLPIIAPCSCVIFGRTISYTGGYWLLYSLNEIFLDELYKFNSANPRPLII